MSTMRFCSKCGNKLPLDSRLCWKLIDIHKWISSVDGKEHQYPIYGTFCCGAKVFSDDNIPWDCDHRLPNGQRIETKDLPQLVKLCCSIGKSPFSIRKGPIGYYFEVKSDKHIEALKQTFMPDTLLLQQVNTMLTRRNK